MTDKHSWMDTIINHLPGGIKGKLVGAKAILVIWDSLSDTAKLEIANAAVERVRKMTEKENGDGVADEG